MLTNSRTESIRFLYFLFIGYLNTLENSEILAGYDRYSSTIADVLSQPGLACPITVGLYAKWGSGKSFILEKLQCMQFCVPQISPGDTSNLDMTILRTN